MRAACRDFDKAEHSARTSAGNPHRARIWVGIERTEGKCDARGADMQFLQQINCGLGSGTGEPEIGESCRPHRRRAPSAAKFGQNHQNLAKSAFAEIAAE